MVLNIAADESFFFPRYRAWLYQNHDNMLVTFTNQ